VPTEYYSLLGLPLFTSDRKEIRSAHRRVVKLCHPDILGADSSGDLLLIVTEAYDTLSDEDKRKEYDEMLKLAKPTLSTSRWGEGGRRDTRGVFVNEVLSNRCYRCVDIATSTFDIHDASETERQEKAYVATQYGDAEEIVVQAVEACPSKAIRFISREDLSLYEYAMAKCAKTRERVEQTGGREEDMPTVQDIMQDYMIDELLQMDMEKALQDAANPVYAEETSEELSEHARQIHDAAETVPLEVRARMWPDTGVDVAVGEQVLKGEGSATAEREGSSDVQSAGEQRANLKMSVFRLYDLDQDGFLFETELRKFAASFGFDGTDADWYAQYDLICSELNCAPGNGVNMRAFSTLVDDEELCYMSDEDLAACLTDSNRLPRAGS
jgi:curved DNA-binding protein CbpA